MCFPFIFSWYFYILFFQFYHLTPKRSNNIHHISYNMMFEIHRHQPFNQWFFFFGCVYNTFITWIIYSFRIINTFITVFMLRSTLFVFVIIIGIFYVSHIFNIIISISMWRIIFISTWSICSFRIIIIFIVS